MCDGKLYNLRNFGKPNTTNYKGLSSHREAAGYPLTFGEFLHDYYKGDVGTARNILELYIGTAFHHPDRVTAIKVFTGGED